MDKIFRRLWTVTKAGIQDTRIFRESLAQPLVAIRPPGHDISPPLMTGFMSYERIGKLVCPVGSGNHQHGWKTLPKAIRVIRRGICLVGISAEQLVKVAN